MEARVGVLRLAWMCIAGVVAALVGAEAPPSGSDPGVGQHAGERAGDRAAILRLRDVDARASRRGDFVTLRGLLADDAIALPPDAPIARGRDAIDGLLAGHVRAARDVEVLEYRFEFDPPLIDGALAVEQGDIVGTVRVRATGAVEHVRYHALRVLRRDPDRRWRIVRTIWTPTP
jgi:ketosteroid isomerase-like protein